MKLRQSLRSILWRVPVEHEVREELAHHLELRTRELVERGVDPEDARRQAAERFGDLQRMEARLAELGDRRNRYFARRQWLDELRQDVTFALRQCRRDPAFTLAAVATLALGIGATTAIFSVVYAVALQPFPFPHPERVLVVQSVLRDRPGSVSGGNYDYIRRHNTSLEHLAAAYVSSFNLAGADVPERVVGMRVTWNYFPVFGIAPLHGRTFSADEDQPGHERVVVLSHRLWQRKFGGDIAIVGREIRLNGQLYEVVGVMPRVIDEVAGNEQLWVPAAFPPARLAMFDEAFLDMYARARADASIAQVNDDLMRVAEALRRDHPEFNRERSLRARIYGEFQTEGSRTRLSVLLGAVLLVLLIACGNVANLLVARLASRSRELSIRVAIGAGRARIVRQVLTESLVLAVMGGAAGVLLARSALPVLVANAPSWSRLETASLNGPVLGVAVGLVAASMLLVGLLPAWQTTRREDLRGELGDGKGGHGAIRPLLRQTIIAAQSALVLVVLSGAALLARSAVNLDQVPLGFDPSGTLVARVGFIGPQYRAPDRVKASFAQLLDDLETNTAVGMAALDTQPPLIGAGFGNSLFPEGGEPTFESGIPSLSHFVTPDYFRVLGIPLKAGRQFAAGDVRSAPLVMIINETAARRAFGSANPVGKRISCCEGGPRQPSWKTVIGVAADVRTRGPAAEPTPEFYLPIAQLPDAAWTWIGNTLTVIVRPAAGEPAAMASVIRDAVRRIDSTLPVFGVGTFDEGLRLMMLNRRFNTALMLLLAMSGLVLAALGIYSVTAWLVAQRTREIGVRMALGASVGDVVRQMAAHGVRPAIIGLAIGTLGALGAGRLLEAQLFQVKPHDPVTLVLVVVLLLIVSALAAMLPAWRASAIDPAKALHHG